MTRQIVFLLLLTPTLLHGAEPISFRNEVMPVFSKAGCNAGVCHGNQNGKGGFKLSLRGENPQQDYLAITRAFSGRRVNPQNPSRSLLLKKATQEVPHVGGERFRVDSLQYRILQDWIAQGLPSIAKTDPELKKLVVSPGNQVLPPDQKTVAIQVTGVFSDGTENDLRSLAVYEPSSPTLVVSPTGVVTAPGPGEYLVTVRYLHEQLPVRLAFLPSRPDFVWSAPEPKAEIDRLIFRKLKSLKILPSPAANDTIFLRRAYTDLLGIPPTAREARNFLEDSATEKRAQLVEELLKRPEYAERWALLWSDLLRNEEKTLDRTGVKAYHGWVKQSIADNKPMNEFVRELIAARGSTYKQPPANYYRAMRTPTERSEATAQVFLGIRLQCAKCHNHPFDRWTQNDYYSWANLFARVDYKIVQNKRRDKNDKHEFNGEQIVLMKSKGDVPHPDTGQPVPPQFLGDGDVSISPEEDRLIQLSQWLTSPNNRQFARAQVNRIWFQLMGRGIVHPIDDFRSTNPPSHPELLEYLTDEFIASGFDLQAMIRLIMNSQVYQLSSVPNDTNRDDQANFARAHIRRLSAEQLLDSFTTVLDTKPKFNGYPAGLRAGQIPGVQAVRPRDGVPSKGDQFLKLFGKPSRLQSCECERSDETTLSQAFEMISGPMLNELLTTNNNRLQQMLDQDRAAKFVVQELYWTALSRPPNPTELQQMTQLFEQSTSKRQTLEDITWALLNSKEFLLRH